MSKPEYTISMQSGYVLVEDPPNYDVVSTEQQTKLREISDACDKAGIRKVLIRGSKANVKLTLSQLYELGEAIAKRQLTIAFVNVHDASQENQQLLPNC